MNHQRQITFLAIHLFLFCSTGKGSQVSHLDSDPTNSEPNIGEITASENSEISDKILCEKALINLADAVAPEALTIKQNIRALLDRIEIENLESNGRLSSHAQSQRSLEIFQQFQWV